MPSIKIGVLTASISRQAGGLFWSVRSLAREVTRAGCAVDVFSIGDRFSAEDAAQWRGLHLNVLNRRGPAAFGYAPGFGRALDGADLDLVHAHGLWMYPSVAAWCWSRRWDRPLVLSPRGMLDPWALSNSGWKKRLAGVLFEHAHLRRVACLHALCESEYQAIRGYGLANPVAVIPNGVVLPHPSRGLPKPDWAADLPNDARVLLFLSRIHPKKGLTSLLHAWARVGELAPMTADSWHLVIAGWDDGRHQSELEHVAKDLELGSRVHFVGPQFDEQKAASLARANAFVLPSLSEGLPMAVLEAWSYGLPVLMTRQCNLPVGFQAKAAIELKPEVRSIVEALTYLFHLSEAECLAMGQKGRKMVAERFSWPTVANQMCSVYAWVLGHEPRPDCVITD